MAKKKAGRKKDDPSFEQSLEALQEIVEQLEEGDLTLSDSLEKYEAGISHLKACYRQLKEAEKKVEVLVSLDQHGNVTTRTFDGTATEFDSVTEESLNDDANRDPMDESDRLF